MSRPAGYPANAFLRKAPPVVRNGYDPVRDIGSLRKGNRNSSYLGRGTICAADIGHDWHGGDYYGPREQSVPRPPASGREATLYAWELLVASYGEREASQRFRAAVVTRGRSGDKLAAQHRLAGYVPAAA